VKAPAQDSDTVGSAEAGKAVYEQTCLACHQVDGSGVPNLAPPLIDGTFVEDKQRLIAIVLNGMQGVEIKGEHYANPMPGFDYLSDKEIADVLTFVRSNFDNKGDAVTVEDVKSVRNTKRQ
jgi:mono/diheme cytochrome c family protein